MNQNHLKSYCFCSTIRLFTFISAYNIVHSICCTSKQIEKHYRFRRFLFYKASIPSHGGLEVERLPLKLHDSTLVGSHPAWRQKEFRSNSNTTGGTLVNKVTKLNFCFPFWKLGQFWRFSTDRELLKLNGERQQPGWIQFRYIVMCIERIKATWCQKYLKKH